ncbi:MAG: tyrosine-type recombinase/integrase [Nitrospiraceae bacterium]
MPKSKKTPSKITFTAALGGYWLARRRDFSPNTIADYERTFTKFAAHIDNAPINTVTTDHINSFLNDLRLIQKLAAKTVANAWTALSSFWTWAETDLKLPHPIRGKIECPHVNAPVVEIYTQIEIKALLGACDQTTNWRTRNGRLATSARPTAGRDKAIIVTLVETGLRASELCNLTVGDYNSTQGRLHIRHGKGDKDRLVFISDTCKKHLWRYLATRPESTPADPLFATARNTHLDRDMLLKMIRTTAERAGVHHAYIHKFRHTFAVNFLRNGGNPLELQSMLGHERMETVRIYARLAEVDLATAQRRASVADNWRL